MDVWEPYAVREHCRDAVRAWAELEGKSPEMTDDLSQRYSLPTTPTSDLSMLAAVVIRLTSWLLQVYSYFRFHD
jgi:hypothetical protein